MTMTDAKFADDVSMNGAGAGKFHAVPVFCRGWARPKGKGAVEAAPFGNVEWL